MSKPCILVVLHEPCEGCERRFKKKRKEDKKIPFHANCEVSAKLKEQGEAGTALS